MSWLDEVAERTTRPHLEVHEVGHQLPCWDRKVAWAVTRFRFLGKDEFAALVGVRASG